MLLTGEICQDISLWRTCMANVNGVVMLLEDTTPVAIYTDACQEGCGGHWGDDWFYCIGSLIYPMYMIIILMKKKY